MKNRVGIVYGGFAKGVFKVLNPIKRRIVKTTCIMHKLINNSAVETLKNCGYMKEYKFYNRWIDEINKGVVWADQDFKSINHFFHHEKKMGLFGFSNAYEECKSYYIKSKKFMRSGNTSKAMFYLGAACHLLQDSTVPHHVYNKLLKNHRSFELWIIEKYAFDDGLTPVFDVEIHEKLEDYITSNIKYSSRVYEKSLKMKEIDNRYLYVSKNIIRKAQKSTAGFLVKYFNDIKEEKRG